jgi:hypothetical protein
MSQYFKQHNLVRVCTLKSHEVLLPQSPMDCRNAPNTVTTRSHYTFAYCKRSHKRADAVVLYGFTSAALPQQ